MTRRKVRGVQALLAILLGYLFSTAGLLLVLFSSATVIAWFLFQESLPQLLPFSLLLAGIIIGWLGNVSFNTGKRLLVRSQNRSAAQSQKDFVLYLRSDSMDRPMGSLGGLQTFPWMGLATEEEQLVQALSEIGPVIALGKAGEFLPPLGAKRIYVKQDEWKERIIEMMQCARLVVALHGSTPGLRWEIDQALRLLPPVKLITAIPTNVFEKAFGSREKRKPKRISTIAGFQYFDENGKPRLARVRQPGLLRRSVLRPKVPAFQLALRPIFDNLSVATCSPCLRLLNPVTSVIAAFVASPLALVGLLFLLAWLTAPPATGLIPASNNIAPEVFESVHDPGFYWESEDSRYGMVFPSQPERYDHPEGYAYLAHQASKEGACAVAVDKLDGGVAGSDERALLELLHERFIRSMGGESGRAEHHFSERLNGHSTLDYDFRSVLSGRPTRVQGFWFLDGEKAVRVSIAFERSHRDQPVAELAQCLSSFELDPSGVP